MKMMQIAFADALASVRRPSGQANGGILEMRNVWQRFRFCQHTAMCLPAAGRGSSRTPLVPGYVVNADSDEQRNSSSYSSRSIRSRSEWVE